MSSKQENTSEKSVNDLKNKVPPVIKSKKQRLFEDQRRELSDREIQIELLYAQQIMINKLDKVRGNTNTLIWWLIAIPIIIGAVIFMTAANV